MTCAKNCDWRPSCSGPAPGFTLIELMVVLAIVAVLTSVVAWSARPSIPHQLHQEGVRLAIWLQATHAQARSAGWSVQARAKTEGVELTGAGTEAGAAPRLTWIASSTQVVGPPVDLVLGPEPFLPAQQWVLGSSLDPKARVRVWTDDTGPWKVDP